MGQVRRRKCIDQHQRTDKDIDKNIILLCNREYYILSARFISKYNNNIKVLYCTLPNHKINEILTAMPKSKQYQLTHLLEECMRFIYYCGIILLRSTKLIKRLEWAGPIITPKKVTCI